MESIDTHSKTTNSGEEAIHSGPLVAATLAPLLGFFTLAFSHHISRLSPELDKAVHKFGHWIPGALGTGADGSIGSYSGKETLAIGVWLVSWLLLHVCWRKLDLSLNMWLRCFMGGLACITLAFFHPLIDPVVIALAGVFNLP